MGIDTLPPASASGRTAAAGTRPGRTETGTPVTVRLPVRAFDPARMCGAKTNPIVGEHPCQHLKGWATDHPGYGHCKMHGGTTPNGKTHAANEAASKALASFGVPIRTEPQVALLELVWEAVGNVSFLRARCNELVEDGKLNLIGNTYVVAQRDGITLPIGEEARGYVKLYGEWCDRLAKYSKAAIDAGIAKREIELAERSGDAICAVIDAVLDGLGLEPERIDAGRRLVAIELRKFAVREPLGLERN